MWLKKQWTALDVTKSMQRSNRNNSSWERGNKIYINVNVLPIVTDAMTGASKTMDSCKGITEDYSLFGTAHVLVYQWRRFKNFLCVYILGGRPDDLLDQNGEDTAGGTRRSLHPHPLNGKQLEARNSS